MRPVVKFLTINNIKPIDDIFSYLNKLVNKLFENGLITNMKVSQTTIDFREYSAIEKITENVFAGEFIYSKESVDTYWQILFEFGTFNSSKQLEITIYSDNYNLTVENNYLESLKLAIKKSVKNDWAEIVWLMDKDSEMLSIELYPYIYRAENLARQLINEIMTKEYGVGWWETYVPLQIKNKHHARMSGYKSTVPGFANVNEKLMSIDIGDLISIFTLKDKTWVPAFNREISHYLNDQKVMNLETIHEILVKQMATTKDLWAEQFSKYLSDDFIEHIKLFEINRNHVVHNKLIDRAAYTSILHSIQDVENELNSGLHKVTETVISAEQRKAISEQRELEREELEASLHDIMESEAGVEIRSIEEIIELYDEQLYEFYMELQSNLRFRNDIEFGKYFNIGDTKSKGILFEINYKIDDETAKVCYELDSIIDSQGAESNVSIFILLGTEQISQPIRYINGEVSFNSFQGNYIPETQDDFYVSDLEELMVNLIEFINEHFENKRESVDSQMYSIIKDGGNSPLADVPCLECGEEYICVDQNYGNWGQCLNCGAINEIAVCSRCNCCFEGTSNEDEPVFCKNCLEHFRKE